MRDHRTSKLRALPMSEIRPTAIWSDGRSIARQTGSTDLGMSINGRGRAQTHGPQWYGSRRPDVVADYGTNRDHLPSGSERRSFPIRAFQLTT